jgi:hypothetical protein
MKKLKNLPILMLTAFLIIFASYAKMIAQETGRINWETYVNEEYGYTLQYPKDWYIEESTELITVVRPWKREPQQYLDPLRDITVKAYPNEEYWQRIKREMELGRIKKKNGLIIGGVRWEEMQAFSDKGYMYRFIFTQKNGLFYSITIYENHSQKGIVGQILESFKFIF